jgi:glycosyltransferase involved in cell wall biosynthesis
MHNRLKRLSMKPQRHSRSVLFLCKSPESASTRYRAMIYFDRLHEAGWRPQIMAAGGGIREKTRVLKAARDAGVVVVLRKLFAWPIIDLLRRDAAALVLDLDDAVFVSSTGSPSASRRRRFARAARRADAVWAGNSYLREHAGRFNRNAILVPTSIDPAPYGVSFEKPDDHVDLVWIGSSATRPYLEQVIPALDEAARIAEEQGLPPLRLKVIADFDLPSQVIPVQAVPWSAETEVRDLVSSHIGIAPLPDDPWTRGKCGLKVLQYMSASLPVVASRFGVHLDQVVDGESGILVADHDQWVRAVLRLAADRCLRQKMGSRSRELVETGYSRDVTATKIIDSLNGLDARTVAPSPARING